MHEQIGKCMSFAQLQDFSNQTWKFKMKTKNVLMSETHGCVHVQSVMHHQDTC